MQYNSNIICYSTIELIAFIDLMECVLVLDHNEEDDGKSRFILSSEKGIVKFGCANSHEREQWMQWLTRATGQTDKPLEQVDMPGNDSSY